MFSSADKTVKSAPAVQQRTAESTFFRKAGEDSFFGAKETTSFFSKPVQAKLTVSTPDDPHEKEADAVAEKVMRMPEPLADISTMESKDENLSSKEEEVQTKQELTVADNIQCKHEPEEKLHAKLQGAVNRKEDNYIDAKAQHVKLQPGNQNVSTKNISLYQSAVISRSGRAPPATSASFEQTLASSKGGGSALPKDTQGFMESRFNADFSGVRIHTDSRAQNLSSQVNAQAFAHGNDIYFNSGKFSPQSSAGGTLLAHELTHTIQQGASKTNSSNVNSKASVSRKDSLAKNTNGNIAPALKANISLSEINKIKIVSSSNGGHSGSKEEAESAPIPEVNTKLQTKGADTATTVNPAATPEITISRDTEIKDLQKKDEQQEAKENHDITTDHMIVSQLSGKSADLNRCACSDCCLTPPENIDTKIFASIDHANTNTVVYRSLNSTVLGRAPPADALASPANILHENNSGDLSKKSYDAPLISTKASDQTIQRDDAPAGADAPKEESFFDKLKSGFDSALKLLLPDAVYTFYTKIKDGGILAFIKDSLVGLFKGLFGKLGFSDKEIQTIFQIFATLKSQLPAIISGLANGDCKPLFAALNLLSQVVSAIAGRVWDNLMAELEPVRLWLVDIWQTFGAPVIDQITAFAGEKWEELKSLGKFVWDSFQPIRDKGAEAWDWVVDKLGFGTSDEPGFLGYISGKISEAWNSIKDELKPVIAPVNDVIEGIKALASLGSIKQLQEDAKQWLDEVVKTATAMGGDEDAVANKQVTLRQVLLPALNKSIDKLKSTLKTAADWVTGKVGLIASSVSSFITGLQGNTYLSPMYSLISWVPRTVDSLKDWAVDKVNDIFEKLQTGAEHLKAFVEPLLQLLEKLVRVVGNLLGYLPDLILGVPFMLMPRCIKDPIIKWLTDAVLKQIPIISDFISLTEKWDEIKTAALTVLKQVFVDGQLAKGLWTFFKTLLGILGIDPKLVTKVVAKAAQNFSDIISKPGAFFQNIWTAIKGGFSLFFDHILIHLPKGALDWLFGEVKGATSVAPPKDFSVSSIFGFVLDLFGITKANIYERMKNNPKIGPEKVAKIQKLENVLTGALEWITVWIKEGAEGLLKKIKKQVGDLKNMVIQGVVSWITTSIVAEITKKLLTSADPLGIGATLNTIKLVYDTLKTAVAYINKMLDMVNSIMDSVGDIISGNTKAASVYLEGVLAKAVPFVVGFAVEVIIGPVGEKIKEIVGDVRKQVDAGIDFLINAALGFIDTVVDTGKAIVDTVAGWLGLKKQFDANDGQQHRLYFEGTEDNPVLMLQSNPTAYSTFIGNLDVGTDEKKKTAKEQAVPVAQAIDTMRKQPLAGATEEEKQNSKAEKIKKVKDLLEDLSIPTAILFGDLSMVGEPEIGYTLQAAGHAVTMTSKKLNKNQKLRGSVPTSANTDSYAILNTRRQGANASYYVKGHMLNENVGGKGTWDNLTPLTRDTNSNHESIVESLVKAAYNSGAVIEYNVTANYGYGNNESAIPDDDPQKDQKIKIIKEEKNVPVSLQCEAWVLENKGNSFERTSQKIISSEIKNTVEQTAASYILDGSAARSNIYLNTSNVAVIATIEDFGAALAVKVKKAHTKSGKERFNSYGDLSNAKDKDGNPIFPDSAEQAKIQSLSDIKYVKLYKG